ncbi:SLAM family member 5 isoform X1 [Xenopus laevis]|uniref:SLAM family member 5 isoform X1 n=1 Tax=Xenopus laevis TaxID=8355 RepID=A0A8J0TKJ8_XENLA|nr:SLAM family member 5 isoform X1 [Xenopus laevis]
MDPRIDAPLLCLILVLSDNLISQGNFIQPINKLINDSVTFTMEPAECAPEDTTIRWKSEEKYQEIGLCRNSHLDGASTQFHKRIECNSDTQVTIRNLTKADNGLYSLSYTLPCKVRKEVKNYNLIVYEPVPALHIEKEVDRNSACWCNFTLHCSVPVNSSVDWYHWQKGRNETGYQHYMNGPSIQVSLESQSLGPLDEEYVCTVYNPANQKSTSIHRKDICTLMADSSIHCSNLQRTSKLLIFIICSTVAYVILAITIIFRAILLKNGNFLTTK